MRRTRQPHGRHRLGEAGSSVLRTAQLSPQRVTSNVEFRSNLLFSVMTRTEHNAGLLQVGFGERRRPAANSPALPSCLQSRVNALAENIPFKLGEGRKEVKGQSTPRCGCALRGPCRKIGSAGGNSSVNRRSASKASTFSFASAMKATAPINL